MQAHTTFSTETLAALGITPETETYSVRDADKLGIDRTGPEYDNVAASDFSEVNHG
jgi:hypothetical protein